MTREEVQQLVLKEMMKRLGSEKFEKNMIKAIHRNIEMMQVILDENPKWGYKIIITDDGYFKLINRQ